MMKTKYLVLPLFLLLTVSAFGLFSGGSGGGGGGGITVETDPIYTNDLATGVIATGTPVYVDELWNQVPTNDIIPDASNQYNLGSADFPFATGYFGEASVFLGETPLTAENGELAWGGPVSFGSGSIVVTNITTNALIETFDTNPWLGDWVQITGTSIWTGSELVMNGPNSGVLRWSNGTSFASADYFISIDWAATCPGGGFGGWIFMMDGDTRVWSNQYGSCGASATTVFTNTVAWDGVEISIGGGGTWFVTNYTFAISSSVPITNIVVTPDTSVVEVANLGLGSEDPIESWSELDFATGTPLYAYTETDPEWGGVSNQFAIDTNTIGASAGEPLWNGSSWPSGSSGEPLWGDFQTNGGTIGGTIEAPALQLSNPLAVISNHPSQSYVSINNGAAFGLGGTNHQGNIALWGASGSPPTAFYLYNDGSDLWVTNQTSGSGVNFRFGGNGILYIGGSSAKIDYQNQEPYFLGAYTNVDTLTVVPVRTFDWYWDAGSNYYLHTLDGTTNGWAQRP